APSPELQQSTGENGEFAPISRPILAYANVRFGMDPGYRRQRGELPVFFDTIFNTKNKRRREVCRLLNAILNNNCSELNNLAVGPRTEDRVNLTRAVRIVPYVEGRLVMDDAFATVTKELSTSGVSVVLKYPAGFDEAVVGINWEGSVTFIHAHVRH